VLGEIELIVAANDRLAVFDEVVRWPGCGRELSRSGQSLRVELGGEEVGIRCPAPDRAGSTLLALTGSSIHFDGLCALAAERGWMLTADGLTRGLDTIAVSEAEIYAALELPFIPPEIREGPEALSAAMRNELPLLVERSDIRGDFHTHSCWSDGRDSIEAMVQGSIAHGYEYIAITDHSQRAGAARTLLLDDVGRQADEIAALREAYPHIAILHGCEVDIMPDGRLDFDDRTLERFDIVLASLHDPAGQSSERLLARYIDAMRHPLVSIVTHPSNRLVPYRRGYEIDYDRLFAGAVETDTILEIDGGPSHLDLDSTLARRAIASGVTVSIDSDAHRSAFLGRQMALGLLTARRAWIGPQHVLNTRSLPEVQRHVRTKRNRPRTDA
jgi:DNA polymerase (family 10)